MLDFLFHLAVLRQVGDLMDIVQRALDSDEGAYADLDGLQTIIKLLGAGSRKYELHLRVARAALKA